jgi:hypothetical protein
MESVDGIKPGVYGGGCLVPQLWVDSTGKISDIQVTQFFTTLEQVTQFNGSTRSTVYLKNKDASLVSHGNIHVNNGKDLLWFDNVGNQACTLGQQSDPDSRVTHFCGSQPDSQLHACNWKKVTVNSGLSVDSSGLTTMKGCFMESGTGYILNAQQLSRSSDDLRLGSADLFKWFSFSSPKDKKILLPDPTGCVAGSWIGITNISRVANIEVFDVCGAAFYTILKSDFNGGNSYRVLCVSSLAPSNGTSVMGDVWVVA